MSHQSCRFQVRRMSLPRQAGSICRVSLASLLAAGVLAASGASAVTPIREGGTLRVNVSDEAILSLDPAVDYDTAGWQIEYATCAKLVNTPDRRASRSEAVVPEVAAGLPAVSDGGRMYTFTIRPGFRFDTGEPVTATGTEEGRRGDPGTTQVAVDDLEGRRLMRCGASAVELLEVTLESAKARKELVRLVMNQTARR